MDIQLKEQFLTGWEKYFGPAELPITFYYAPKSGDVPTAAPPKGWSCLVGELARVRRGESLAYTTQVLACGGAQRYLGFTAQLRPHFEYFLSHGLPGKVEGERYKKSPDIVLAMQKNMAYLDKAGQCIIFKRWDNLTQADHPDVVIFFATPDVLAGLFTLANFDEVPPDGVMAPFGAGCGTIVHYPYLEKDKERPRAIIGMFDPSARPYVPAGVLTFAVPMNKFTRMVANMEESFLITPTWTKVRQRLARQGDDTR